MKHVRRDDAKYTSETRGQIRFDYGSFGDFNFSKYEINGRFPETGERVCEETSYLFITFGDGEVFVNGQRIFARKGDLLAIEKGESYYLSGKFDAATYTIVK
ncbi:MAG: hypothetical protein FWD89_03220 [Firmicutes bacterium]|nr:hypothetical protein [Bacillota bacterium]MCL2771301.1 hypothetical protein [Bacillota bacterium]